MKRVGAEVRRASDARLSPPATSLSQEAKTNDTTNLKLPTLLMVRGIVGNREFH